MSCMSQEPVSNEVIRAIEKAISGLEFGEVNITVHHFRVVKIEKIERTRLRGIFDVAVRESSENQGGDS